MKKSLVIAAMLVLVITVSSVPNAQADCKIPQALVDLAKKINEECKKLAGTDSKFKDCAATIDKFKALSQKWNSLVGNSPLKIGPRDMAFNTDQLGTLIAPADRRFVSELIETNKGVTITVTKRKPAVGEEPTKGGCVVNICVIDPETQAETQLASVEIDKDAAVGTQVTRSFSAAQVGGKIVITRLDGKGLAARFPYTFRASKN